MNWFSKEEKETNHKSWRVVHIFLKLRNILDMNKNIEDLKSITNLHYLHFSSQKRVSNTVGAHQMFHDLNRQGLYSSGIFGDSNKAIKSYLNLYGNSRNAEEPK